MMTMLGTMTTTSVLIAAEAATAARSAAASRFGAGPRAPRSWLHPAGTTGTRVGSPTAR
ncbi:hypothetical protein [Aeromicrobium wangtongii]|uniref:hypothetical protein n=1 Tax=Aeromicrobium wangtongii TaxID=2969247 RepID=UPI0020174AAB|nr:hypothetical protein [Aeromicrobium wangtongii]MCL3819637.1 hypothetical protein [Aeromicrobium wangtongii]